MPIEFISCFLQGAISMLLLVVGIFLLCEGKKTRIRNLFAIANIYASLCHIKQILFYFDILKQSVFLERLFYSFDFLIYPFAVLLVFELLSFGWVTLKRVILLFVPSVLFLVSFALTNNEYIFLINYIYTIIFTLISFVVGFFAATRYDKYLTNYYSETSNKRVDWILIIAMVYFVLFLTYSVLIFNRDPYTDSIFYALFLIVWGVLIFFSDKQKLVDVKDNIEFNNVFSKDINLLNENECDGVDMVEVQQKLSRVISERMYLNPELTLDKISNDLGLKPDYILLYLKRIDVSFYDYINRMRVGKASELISNKRVDTLEDIIEQCGFINMTSFQNAYKRYLGVLPAINN